MAKTRTAEKPSQSDAEEKSADGLEIISIGSLYRGSWDKKYWTSSRGKDRYPYPVGYKAVRAHNGTTYKMEIREGVNGPRFLISSDDGSSYSGKTPDQAWDEFQKKGSSRTKIWHGKRLSSKMDGLEFFGFKNPFIHRMLRELVTDINGIAEQSIKSPNVCDEVTRMDHDDCDPNKRKHPDLLLYLGKPCVTGKRSRYELKVKKLNVQARPQSPELACSIPLNVKEEKKLGQGCSATDTVSEANGVCNHLGLSDPLQKMTSVGKSNNCISSKNGLLLNPIDISDDKIGGSVPSNRSSDILNSTNCKTTELAENLSTEEPLHRSHDVEFKMPSLLVTPEDKKLTQSCSKDSVGCIDIDLCAPDTLDFVQENTSDSAPSKVDNDSYIERACEIASRDLINPQNEVLKSNSNPCSEKGNFGSAGQDVANAMISLLIPQAVPLLRNVSTDKEFTVSPTDILTSSGNSKKEQSEVGYILDVPSSDVILAEAAYREQGVEVIHRSHIDPQSNTPNSEHMKSIVPDSYEYSQCDDFKTNQEILYFDIAEADKSNFDKEMCSQQPPGCDIPPDGTSTCHSSGLGHNDSPQDCNVCIPESDLGYMSPEDCIISERRINACSDLHENPAHAGFSSIMPKDQSTTNDFIGDVGSSLSGVETNSCLLKSTETLAEKTQDEIVGKTSNAEPGIMSSQLPNFVYTRRKHRNVIPSQENCSVMESIEYDKFKLVTPDIYTPKGTIPPPETTELNNSTDKPCEPDDTAGFRVDTPLMPNDVLGEYSNPANPVEPNPTSLLSTPFPCENNCFGHKEVQLISESMPLKNQEINNSLGSSARFVGCYKHPMPVSSLFLITRNDEIHVCVLCGLPMGQYRTLFTYNVAINETSFGCPSVMAHSSILLPDPRHNFIKETMLERSGVQLTPDGQFIILIGSIKTPNCREGKIDCYCSTCTSACSDNNALRIVQVALGYVSVVTTLETIDNVHCILVCEPNRLISVGESGRLQVWVMNSTWSEKVEYFIIPADGSISPGIVELKRIPKCAHLVVGQNSCGEFSLWDIEKLTCVSSFSALRSPINDFFPISLFRWQTKGSGSSIEEKADKLLEETNLWFSEPRETSFSSLEEDAAMWLFVLTTSDMDMHTSGSWKLALLMKDGIIFQSPLDPRTTGIGVSCGYGIIGTSDGAVYMWELSKGSKFGSLHHFQDGNVTCVATDNSRGALGVAGDGGQLLLYLHLPGLDSN